MKRNKEKEREEDRKQHVDNHHYSCMRDNLVQMRIMAIMSKMADVPVMGVISSSMNNLNN